MTGWILAIGVSGVLVGVLVALMRRRRLKEKYAFVWLVVVLGASLFAFFPRAAEWLAGLAGVETPSNLIFILALLVLLGVTLQLSVEASKTEEDMRTLAEQIAFLRHDLDELRPAADTDSGLGEPSA